MKKLFLFLLAFILLILNIFTPKTLTSYASDVTLEINAPSCCLMEPTTKRVIYSKNENKRLYPASMTKMMGLSLVLEEIHKGNVSWDDEVVASSYASSMGGTQIYLEEGEKMALSDLFKAVAVNSANDAIVALMEHLYGSKEGFLAKMNAKAKELNMLSTNFNNATGFDDENHYTTSYDMALLGSYLVSFGEDILSFTSLTEAYIREDSSSPFWLVNTNKLLRYYEGMDGLKTGYTSKAGYNLTATAKRNGVRLISVVMNEDSIASRSKDTVTLLNHGFSSLKCISLYKANDIVKYLKVNDYKEDLTPLYLKEDVNIILYKNEDENDLLIQLEINDIYLPLRKDDVIGKLKISYKDNLYASYDVYVSEDVNKLNFFELFIKNLLLFFK